MTLTSFFFFLLLSNTLLVSASLLSPLLNSGISWDYCTVLSPDVLFTWTYIPENDTITVGISSSTIGYQAVGFNELPQMISADVMISQFEGGVPLVQDFYISKKSSCNGNSGVCTDLTFGYTDDNPLVLSSQRDSDSTWITYNRFRIGSDVYPFDQEVPIDEDIWLVWALGTTDQVGYHLERGLIPFHLTDPVLSCSNNCSGNGDCYGRGCCVCDTGYSGFDCSIPDDILLIPSAVVNASEYEFGGDLDDNMELYWSLKQDKDERTYIDAGMIYKGNTVGWFAVGFSQSSGGHMAPADVIVCNIFGPTTFTVFDYTFLSRNMEGTLYDTSVTTSEGQNGENNIFASNATGTDDRMYCKWRRYINTQDELDSIVTDTSMKCIYAHSEDPTWGQHEWRNRGRVKINWFTGSIELETNLWVIHGGLMFAAWGVLIPLGSLLARYFKFIGHAWFETHRAVQMLAIFAQIAGFGVVVAAVDREDGSHFSTTHERMGLAVFIMACLQPFLGQLADYMWDSTRTKTPIFPDRIHALLGWSSVVLAFVTIGLGLDYYQSPSLIIILYGTYVGVFVVSAIVVHFLAARWSKAGPAYLKLGDPVVNERN